jgi:hypothetical protein
MITSEILWKESNFCEICNIKSSRLSHLLRVIFAFLDQEKFRESKETIMTDENRARTELPNSD